MPKHTYVVKVPRPHAPRFEPDRPITDLVRNQVMHLSLAQRQLHKKHHHPTDIYSIKTEGEASHFIGHVTAKLHSSKKSSKAKPTRRAKTAKSKARRKSSRGKPKGKG